MKGGGVEVLFRNILEKKYNLHKNQIDREVLSKAEALTVV